MPEFIHKPTDPTDREISVSIQPLDSGALHIFIVEVGNPFAGAGFCPTVEEAKVMRDALDAFIAKGRR